MLKIKLADGAEYDVLENTAVYPAYGAGRSRFEIHMAADAMDTAVFEALFTDESKTCELRLIGDQFDTAYFHYVIVSAIGKKRVERTSPTTGEVMACLELVAELEQLTYIEQQLRALGIAVQ